MYTYACPNYKLHFPSKKFMQKNNVCERLMRETECLMTIILYMLNTDEIS